jgi:diaminopimelate decarboxylase
VMDNSTTAHAVIERCFGYHGPELHVGGLPIHVIAEHYGTPLFVYDRRTLERSLIELRAALPPRFEIYYSVKANPNHTILKHFLKHGCGLEIASGGEYLKARSAGCSPERIIYAGPGKTVAELEFVLSEGVGEIHLESRLEAERLAALSTRIGRQTKVAIRINPSEDIQGGALLMGGRATPFGVDEENLNPLVDYVLIEPSLDLRGIHIYAGTQILDVDVIVSHYRKALQLARRVAMRSGKPICTVDFGGGMGIPYFLHESAIDLDALRDALARLMAETQDEPCFQDARFLAEPGRYLVAEAGIYVARIVDIKVSRGKKFLVMDGGMNHHLAASGNLGQTIKRNYPIALLTKLDQPAEETVDIVGPLCTPLDMLGRGIRLPKADVGDLVGIFQSGAYALSASPTGFLSHNIPAEVWIDNAKHRKIN